MIHILTENKDSRWLTRVLLRSRCFSRAESESEHGLLGSRSGHASYMGQDNYRGSLGLSGSYIYLSREGQIFNVISNTNI